MTRSLWLIFLFAGGLLPVCARAAPGNPLAAPAAPQQLSADCDKAAVGLSGLARRDFLDDCRSNGVHSAITNPAGVESPSVRDRRLRDCAAQADAQKLSGPPRTTFMDVCRGS